MLVGIAYGAGAGTIRRDTDVLKAMSKSMETMGSYLVLVFFAAQFVAVFNWTNLGLIVAVEGAAVLMALGLGTVVALMLPYSATFAVVWTVFLVAWALLGIPVGPGAPLLLDSPLHVQ